MIEQINKPWGKEFILEKNEEYVVKRLFIKQGFKTSLQYHNEKHEFFYVISGKFKFLIGESKETLEEKIIEAGYYIAINPGTIHRMEALESGYYLECSTTQLDDVVRLEDDFGR